MKTPNFVTKLAAVLSARKKNKLNVAARTAPRAAMNDYDAEEPTTRLSSAFIVVFALHVVAIGGIYAFNGIKASRLKNQPPAAPAAQKPKPAASQEVKTPALPAPTARAAAEHASAIPPVPVAVNAKPTAPKQYQVKAGDNPTKIAIAFGVKADELLAANSLKDGAILQVGQILTIPASKPSAKPVTAETPKAAVSPKQTDVPPTRTTPGIHVVKKGDTATSIAKSYGRTSEEILKLNRITDSKKLQLGQVLKIPPKKG